MNFECDICSQKVSEQQVQISLRTFGIVLCEKHQEKYLKHIH